jgi:hypothetical protein
MTVNYELKNNWKQADLVYFNILYNNLARKTEENSEDTQGSLSLG